MPLTTSGEGYRVFSEPAIFEAETVAQVRQIEWPTEKAYVFMGLASSGQQKLYKFDGSDASADNGDTILKPINPEFDSNGRWIAVLDGSGSGSAGANFLSGNGSPEGVVTGEVEGQTYLDLDASDLWVFGGTVGTDTGWVAAGTASGDVAFTDTSGALSVESSVADGSNAVAFTFDTSSELSTTGALVSSFKNAGESIADIDDVGGVYLGVDSFSNYGAGQDPGLFVDANIDESQICKLYLTDHDTAYSSWNETLLHAGRMELGVATANRTLLDPSRSDGSPAYFFDTSEAHASGNLMEVRNNGTLMAAIGAAPSAGQTNLYLLDADNATLQQVTLGAADSGGAGFRVLRIPNGP